MVIVHAISDDVWEEGDRQDEMLHVIGEDGALTI